MIWVIGKDGMQGKDLCRFLKSKGVDFISTGHEVDICDYSALKSFSAEKPVTWIINCAACTAVDQLEDEYEKAYAVNACGAENLALIAGDLDAKLIHISTDYVFDGKSEKPYSEEDKTNPVSVYGKTKLSGENLIQKAWKKSYILRTSWLYGFDGANFVTTILQALRQKTDISVVADQTGCPTYCKTLSSLIFSFIQADKSNVKIPYGIYNCTDEGQSTRYELALKIKEYGKKYKLLTDDCKIRPDSMENSGRKAPRPKYSVLKKSKVQSALLIKLPDWSESLEAFVKQLAADKLDS